jgi:UDP-N-acetylglucosamine acyltransferase
MIHLSKEQPVDIIPMNSVDSGQASRATSAAITVSPLAEVHPDAQLGEGVTIGPFCVVGPHVKIGARTQLLNSVNLVGRVTLGCDNVIWPGTCIGGEPQDISYRGTPTEVIVGDHNIIRENVTINRGSEKEDGRTVVGNGNYFMANAHVGHDCVLSDRIIIGQGSMLGGHCHIHSNAILSGCVAVHHFASIGRFAFVGGVSKVLQDIPPYMLADGNPARCKCSNIVALKRNNFARTTITALNETFRLLFRARAGLVHAREVLKTKEMLVPEVLELLDFLDHSKEGRHGRSRHIPKAA